MTEVTLDIDAGRPSHPAPAPAPVIAPPVAWRRDRLALGFGVLAFCLHAFVAGRYDVFRDELYFIVCGRHPAFGYADQPPGVPLLAAGFYALGGSLWLLRLPATVAAGALAWLTVRFARLLGGGALAGAVAALSVTIAPMLMGVMATLNTTTFDPLAWTAIAWCLACAVKTGNTRVLWLCGVVAGLDLEIKYALVFWALGLGVGLALTPEVKLLARRTLWLGVAVTAIIAAPSLIWQGLHGFPFIALASAARVKNADTTPAAFILNQVLVMGPVLAPVWLSGVLAPFLRSDLRSFRFLAIGFGVCAFLVIATHGKDYYLAASYPTMIVIGAVAMTRWLRSPLSRAALLGWSAVAVAFSAWIAPLTLPVLPVAALRAYVANLPIKVQQQEKSFHGTLLPQEFADQLGWRDFASEVANAWDRIPASQRGRTSIKVDNYGEAAALDVYGGPEGLPPALSGHNEYFIWGLRGQHPQNLLVVQNHPERLAPFCGEATVLARTASPDAMRDENGKAIAFCRGLKVDLETLWPQLKSYN